MRTKNEPWYYGYNDKLLHLIAGFIIFIISLGLYFFKNLNFEQVKLIALLLVLLTGILKELYDVFVKKSKFNLTDMLATWAGGFIPYLTMVVIENLLPQNI